MRAFRLLGLVLYVCLFLLIKKLEQFRTTSHCRRADMAAAPLVAEAGKRQAGGGASLGFGLRYVCALLLLQSLLLSRPPIEAPCSSHGKLVLRGGSRPSSETCVGTFHGAGKQEGQDRAELFQCPSRGVLWPHSIPTMGTFSAAAVVGIP